MMKGAAITALTTERLAVGRSGGSVVEGVTFHLGAGSALLVRGPNGSGKSSLLKVLAGLIPSLSGAIHLETEHRRRAAHRTDLLAACHYVGHASGTASALTVEENIAFQCRLFGAPIEASLAERLALAPLRTRPAGRLSAGERRRLTLVRLIAAPRPIWLLDEPATSLDAAGLAVLFALIAEHRAAGGLVLMAMHGEAGLAGAATLTLAPPVYT